jgi:AcrR family transcriptional regulator
VAGTLEPPQRGYGGRSAAERRADRRDRLMEAGLEVFGTEGYRGASIERLCALAGVSTRNFYEEFTSREALLVALHERVTRAGIEAVAGALADAGREPLRTRMEVAVHAYLDATASDPRWARIAFVESIGVSSAMEAQRAEWRGKWVALMTREAAGAMRRGEAPRRDFHLSAVALIGAVNELGHHWSLTRRTIPLEDVAAEVARLAVAALTL